MIPAMFCAFCIGVAVGVFLTMAASVPQRWVKPNCIECRQWTRDVEYQENILKQMNSREGDWRAEARRT